MAEFIPPNVAKLVKIQAEDIKVGMYMSFPDRPWLDTPFLFQGLILDSDKLVAKVRAECKFIYVDKEKSTAKPEPKKVSSPPPLKTNAPPIKAPIEREFANAMNAHADTKKEIEDTLKKMVAGDGINVTRIRGSVKTCVKSIMTNPNAMLWLGKLRNKDNYIAEHCLNVGILAIAFGRHLGLSESELETLGMCGMLHDVGKLKVDQRILDKPSSLTEEEFAVIQEHCTAGKDILSQDPNVPKVVVEAAWGHHERADGTGYPRRLKADSLHAYTRIISIVDTYDAITTNRCYDKSRPATEAMKILFACRGTQFEPNLVEKFIECLGIYPIGSLVELRSGEGAVVIDSNKNSRLHPRVTIVMDEAKHYRAPLIVDTSAHVNDSAERTIRRVLDENEFPIKLDDIFLNFVQKRGAVGA